MTTALSIDSELIYPDSDGQPMSDNTKQFRWIVLIKENLEILYANIFTLQDFMNYQDIITIEPGKRSGKPCIRGMRITVYDILEYLAGGMTEAEILEDFSELTSEDIKACLAFAADREKKLFVASL